MKKQLTDDGSCVAVVNGCTDEAAFNYEEAANTDDGSCVAVVNGCTDESACNYNGDANVDERLMHMQKKDSTVMEHVHRNYLP